jgi:cytochrome c oxidase subunit IV
VPVYQDILPWDRLSQVIEMLLWPIQVAHLMVLAMLKDVDYLLIAKPVAFNQLGIRCDCATSLLMLSVIGSSL